MAVKAAVKLATEHVLDLFAEENISNLGLEEVEYNEAGWFMRTAGLLASFLFLLLSATSASADICGEGYPPVGMKAVYTYTGAYDNHAWGYKVVIPRGLVGGLYQDPAAPQHGIQVILSWKPRSTIYFSGRANSAEDEEYRPLTAQGYALQNLSYYKQDAQVLSFKVRKAKLGRHAAWSWFVKYRCPKSKAVRVGAGLVAIPPEPGPVYEVDLETTEARYAADHKVLEKIARSFRLIEWR